MAASTVSNAVPAPQLPTSADRMAKADLDAHSAAHIVQDVAAETVRKLYPKQEAAAIDLDMDRSRFNHKLRDGSLTLAHLDQLGPDYIAAFAAELQKRSGEHDPKARLRRLIRDAKARLDEIAEELAS